MAPPPLISSINLKKKKVFNSEHLYIFFRSTFVWTSFQNFCSSLSVILLFFFKPLPCPSFHHDLHETPSSNLLLLHHLCWFFSSFFFPNFYWALLSTLAYHPQPLYRILVGIKTFIQNTIRPFITPAIKTLFRFILISCYEQVGKALGEKGFQLIRPYPSLH